MKIKNCHLCEYSNLFYREWGGVECSNCRSINSPIIPSEQELIDHYSRDIPFYSDALKKKSLFMDSKISRYSYRYLKLVLRFVNSGLLLDIGSANTPFPNYAAKSKFVVTSADIAQLFNSSEAVERIQLSLNNEKMNKDLIKRFDIITCFAVLEHTINPDRSIKNITSLVKSGGKVFITMPNIGEWYDWITAGGSQWYDPPGHLHIISRKATISLFKRHGCKIINHGVFELNTIRFIMRYGVLITEGCLGWVIKFFFPNTWQKMRNKKRSYGMGLSYFVFEKI